MWHMFWKYFGIFYTFRGGADLTEKVPITQKMTEIFILKYFFNKNYTKVRGGWQVEYFWYHISAEDEKYLCHLVHIFKGLDERYKGSRIWWR